MSAESTAGASGGSSSRAVSFAEFGAAAPELAGPTRARLEAAGLGFLGTVRADGSPRVSPVEVTFLDERLYVGMMPGSRKTQDLERDPRCCLVTALADRNDTGGEGKLTCTARPLPPQDAAAVLAHVAATLGLDPDVFGESPVWELEVREAAWQHVEGDAFVTVSWKPGQAVRRRTRVGATGDVVDVGDVGDVGGVAGG